MRKMKDSGVEWIGKIPKYWNEEKVKYLVKIVNGYSFKSELYTDRGINVIRITNVDDGKINDDNPRFYSNEYSSEIGEALLKENDLLMSLTGNVGYIGIVEKIILPAGVNQRVGCIRVNSQKINNKFVYYYFNTKQFQKEAMLNANGTAQLNLSTEWLGSQKICFPDCKEQEKISHFLDEKVAEIDNIIEKTKETINDYKKYKQSIITEIITKGLKKDKPKCWNKTKIKYLADLNPKCEKVIMKDDEVTYTPMEYIKNGYYIQNAGLWKNNTSSYNTYLENDIVMAKVTPCFENGNIAIMNNLIKGIGYGSSELIVFRCKNKIENKYLFYLLQSEVFKKLCISTMTGTGGLKRVSIDFIKNYVCYIPGKVEQKSIVNYLDLKCKEIEKLVESKENLIGELENYKKSLIYEYVTGKKEVVKHIDYSAEDISNWILNKNLENRRNGKETVGITNLKLQKLLYYASGVYFLYKKCNLIKEDFVAWKHGPVIKQIYYKYNSNGAKEIQHNRKSKIEIDNETQEILEKMYSKYSQYTAEELRNMTHQERPWKKTSRNKIIEKDLIKDYFENEYKWEQ